MARIGVLTNCTETVLQLETTLKRRGHTVVEMEAKGRSRESVTSDEHPFEGLDLIVVDADRSDGSAFGDIRSIAEDAATALAPVLVAVSPESQVDLAVACAYGASGILTKPFTSVETVPDTERALTASPPAG